MHGHIMATLKSRQHIIYIVHDDFNYDPFNWESKIVDYVTEYISTNNLQFDIKEIIGAKQLKQELNRKKFTSYDKIIFPNAWSSMPIYTKHLIENNKTVAPTTYGFWRRGSFINADEKYRPIWNRDYRKSFERSIHRCLDKSFFLTDLHVNQFRHFICRPKLKPWRAIKCNFPLQHIPGEIRETLTDVKQDLIVFPFKNPTELEDKIVYDFKRVLAPAIAHSINEEGQLTREQYLYQAQSAKIMFLPLHYETIGQFIYEAYALKCIPVVPDIEYYKDWVPDEFRYDPKITFNIYNYTQYAAELTDKIKYLLDNYTQYTTVLEDKLNYLTNTYYTTEFLNFIFDKK